MVASRIEGAMPRRGSILCRAWEIAVFFAAAVMCLGEALAATVAVVDRPNCHVRLDGNFAQGDDKKLEAAEQKVSAVFDERAKGKPDSQERDILLCLNSTGGDPEAVNAVIAYIRKAVVIGTVVDDGDKCHGACALVFMMGRVYEHHTITYPNRNLHPRGELAFHVPYGEVKSADALAADRAFGDGVRQVARIMGLDDKHTRIISPVIPRPLLARMLINGPDKALSVATVADAHAWNIDLIDTRAPSTWTHGMLQRACHYKDSELRGTGIAPKEPATPDPPVVLKGNRQRTVLNGFGESGRDKCFVDLYRSDQDGMFIHVTIGKDAQAIGVPKAEDLAGQVTSWLKRVKQSTAPARHSIPTCCMSQSWKVHPGATKISSLAK
jgi:hypothetical protein